MGYRSDLVIAVRKDKLPSEKLPMFLELSPDETRHDDYAYRFKYTYLKWYIGYPEIDCIEDFLRDLDETEYGFIRLGEDPEDCEEEGSPYAFGISYRRDVVI